MDPGSDFIVSYFCSRMYGGYPEVGKYLGSVRCRICMHRQNLINAPGALAPLCSKRYKQRESQYGHSVQSTILTTWLAGRMSVCLSVQSVRVGGQAGLLGWCVTNTRTKHRYTDRQLAILSVLRREMPHRAGSHCPTYINRNQQINLHLANL